MGIKEFLGNIWPVKNITVQELQKTDEATIFKLDVRQPQERQINKIENSTLIPLNELSGRLEELEDQRNKTIIVYCAHGNRSQVATALLKSKGFEALNLAGGMQAYLNEMD